MEIHLRTTECCLPYEITQYYLPGCQRTQANTPHLNPSQWRLVLDLPTPEGWKAELT